MKSARFRLKTLVVSGWFAILKYERKIRKLTCLKAQLEHLREWLLSDSVYQRNFFEKEFNMLKTPTFRKHIIFQRFQMFMLFSR